MALFGRRKPGFSKEVELKPGEIPGEFSDALDPAVNGGKLKPVIEDLDAVIRREGKKPIKIESWRFYSIMDALRWMDVDRQKAEDTAKKCGRTHEQITFQVTDKISIELKQRKEKKRAAEEKNIFEGDGSLPD